MKQPCYLTPWDLSMMSTHYIQYGLLFTKPVKPPPPADDQEDFIKTLLHKLKHSLSVTLVHFYPLSGRLVTLKKENPPSYVVFVDCNNSLVAKFIHASLDKSISDIFSSTYVPPVVHSFFDHDRAINHDGQTRPLLSVQVTELVDGVFIGCSMNHSLVDGTSFWNFFNAWSEIFRGTPSCQPIVKRWFPDGHDPIINLPYTHQDELISRYEAPKLLERFFHFTAESIAKLKAKANAEGNTNKISSFQSLCALVWKSITRARTLPRDQTTRCIMAINDKPRLEPPLSHHYSGATVQLVEWVATAGELLDHDLGWTAWKLNQAVVNHTDQVVRKWLDEWRQSPSIYKHGSCVDPYSLIIASSPRFNKYGNEFGLGKPVAVRIGYGNKVDGCISAYPGREGGGSIDLEVCLPPAIMRYLELNEEFMDAAS